ncbi:8-oxo-dGTP diphosphatase MutT [Ningiella sp. W23]|uniref:8-oxo-dGTP diphosphatase MutT n=1 Tax=Ningiella sp. W23 TaxID=3023715 RepID=UPI00375631A2
MKQVDVAVGVVYKADDTGCYFFVCKRHADQHQGNKWEFPGGKVDAGESPEQALSRELKEEIDIKVHRAEALTHIDFSYPEKSVSLHVYLVSEFDGTAKGAEGQIGKWISADALSSLSFPDANAKILVILRQKGLIPSA